MDELLPWTRPYADQINRIMIYAFRITFQRKDSKEVLGISDLSDMSDLSDKSNSGTIKGS